MKITKTITNKIRKMAEITDYGLDWVRYMDPGEAKSYQIGAIETVGHQLACMISQWVTHDSEPTSDVVMMMKLHDMPSRDLLVQYLRRYLKGYGPQ